MKRAADLAEDVHGQLRRLEHELYTATGELDVRSIVLHVAIGSVRSAYVLLTSLNSPTASPPALPPLDARLLSRS